MTWQNLFQNILKTIVTSTENITILLTHSGPPMTSNENYSPATQQIPFRNFHMERRNLRSHLQRHPKTSQFNQMSSFKLSSNNKIDSEAQKEVKGNLCLGETPPTHICTQTHMHT